MYSCTTTLKMCTLHTTNILGKTKKISSYLIIEHIKYPYRKETIPCNNLFLKYSVGNKFISILYYSKFVSRTLTLQNITLCLFLAFKKYSSLQIDNEINYLIRFWITIVHTG